MRGLIESDSNEPLAACALPCAYYLCESDVLLRSLRAAAPRVLPILIRWLLAGDAASLAASHRASDGNRRRATPHVLVPGFCTDAEVDHASSLGLGLTPTLSLALNLAPLPHPHQVAAERARCAAMLLENMRANEALRNASIRMLRDESPPTQVGPLPDLRRPSPHGRCWSLHARPTLICIEVPMPCP